MPQVAPLRATKIYSGARMVALMNRPKIVPVYVRVELRCGEVGVAEHLLYRAKICPALEQVRRKRVAQRVRRHALGEAGTPRVGFDDAPRTDARERRASRVQEQDAATFAAIQIGPYAFDVHRDFADGAPADGHEPFLAALSEYACHDLFEKQILQLHTDELRDAHAGGICELQQRVIANGQRLIGVGRLEELLHLDRKSTRLNSSH